MATMPIRRRRHTSTMPSTGLAGNYRQLPPLGSLLRRNPVRFSIGSESLAMIMDNSILAMSGLEIALCAPFL